jgi:hypothetical protein
MLLIYVVIYQEIFFRDIFHEISTMITMISRQKIQVKCNPNPKIKKTFFRSRKIFMLKLTAETGKFHGKFLNKLKASIFTAQLLFGLFYIR